MNGISLYTEGTATFTNGSTAIVGVGTFWSGLVDGDTVLAPDGKWYELTFTDDTHATLDRNYAGTTAPASSYTIFKNSAGRDTVRQISQQLSTLTSAFRNAINVTGDDKLVKLNKLDAADLSGVELQRNAIDKFRLGLFGTDDFTIQWWDSVGALWKDALHIDTADGTISDLIIKPVPGTTGRSINAHFGDVFNVLDYGAKGDGVTDDWAAIKRAIDAMPAAGGRLYFPGRYTYLIKQTIRLKSNIRVTGDGANSIIKLDHTAPGLDATGITGMSSGHLCAVFANADFVSGNSNIYIDHVQCDITDCPTNSVDNGPATLSTCAIFFHKLTYGGVSNCRLIGSDTNYASQDGTAFLKSSFYIVENNYAEYCCNCGFDQWDGSHDFIIRNNTAKGGKKFAAQGVLATGGNTDNTIGNPVYNFMIVGNKAIDCGAGCVWVQGSGSGGTGTCYNGIVEGNITENTTADGVIFTGSISGTTLTVTAITAGSIFPGLFLWGNGVTPFQWVAQQLTGTTGGTGTYRVGLSQTLGSTTFTDLPYGGIRVSESSRISVINNVIRGTQTGVTLLGEISYGLKDGIVAGNNITNIGVNGLADSAILVGASSDNVLISGNNVGAGNHTWALNIVSGATKIKAFNNTLTAGTSGDWVNNGGTTCYVDNVDSAGVRTLTGRLMIKVADGAMGLLVRSSTDVLHGGLRILPAANGATVEATDATGIAAYQQLGLIGSTLFFQVVIGGSPATALTFNATGAQFLWTTASTSTSTGALTVNGGVGILGALNAGGNISSGGAYLSNGKSLADQNTAATTGFVYSRFWDGTGANIALLLGGSSDPSNLYRNTQHVFGNIGGSVTYAVLNATSFSLSAGAANGSINVSSTGSHTPTINLWDTTDGGWNLFTQSGVFRLSQAGTSGNFIANRFSITAAGVVSVLATTASTSSTTGALVVSGGLGLAGSANIDGAIGVGSATSGPSVIKNGNNNSVLQFIQLTPASWNLDFIWQSNATNKWLQSVRMQGLTSNDFWFWNYTRSHADFTLGDTTGLATFNVPVTINSGNLTVSNGVCNTLTGYMITGLSVVSAAGNFIRHNGQDNTCFIDIGDTSDLSMFLQAGVMHFRSNNGTTYYGSIGNNGFYLFTAGAAKAALTRDGGGHYTQVCGPNGTPALYLGDNETGGDQTNYYQNNNHFFRNRGSGIQVKIGATTTDGSAKFQVIVADPNNAYNASPVAGIIFQTAVDAVVNFASGGAVTVEKDNATSGNGDFSMYFHTRSNAGGAVAKRWQISAAGSLFPVANNTYDIGSTSLRVATIYAQNALNTSDARAKSNVVPFRNALKRAMKLKVNEYDYHDSANLIDGVFDLGKTKRRSFGLIAQEAREVFGEGLVFGDEEHELLSIDKGQVGFIALAALQEHVEDTDEKITRLTNELDQAKDRIQNLEDQLRIAA